MERNRVTDVTYTRIKLQLYFTWTFSPLYRPLSINILRETFTYIGNSRFFPMLDQSMVILFDFETNSDVTVTMMDWHNTNVHCLVSETMILCLFRDNDFRAVQLPLHTSLTTQI